MRGGGDNDAAAAQDATQAQQQQFLQAYLASQVQGEALRKFWAEAKAEVEAHSDNPADFKSQQLPLARIKKARAWAANGSCGGAAPVVFAKACELFIRELSLRAWGVGQERNHRTVSRADMAAAITRTEVFDFLVDVVPREDGGAPGGGGLAAPPDAQAAVFSGLLPPPLGMYPPLPAAYLAPPPGAMLPPPGLDGAGGSGSLSAQAAAQAMAAAQAAVAAQQQGQQAGMGLPPGMHPGLMYPAYPWASAQGMPLMQPPQMPGMAGMAQQEQQQLHQQQLHQQQQQQVALQQQQQ
eukprot:scaffold3.g6241.t1